MKKITILLALLFAVTFTTQAQEKQKREKMSTEQQTTLAVKKMTLRLDLTANQQTQVRSLIVDKIANRKAMISKRKTLKEGGKKRQKLTADQRFEKANAQLDKQIAMRKSMKNILNEEQFKKFEKMQKGRKMRAAKKMKKMKAIKKKKAFLKKNKRLKKK